MLSRPPTAWRCASAPKTGIDDPFCLWKNLFDAGSFGSNSSVHSLCYGAHWSRSLLRLGFRGRLFCCLLAGGCWLWFCLVDVICVPLLDQGFLTYLFLQLLESVPALNSEVFRPIDELDAVVSVFVTSEYLPLPLVLLSLVALVWDFKRTSFPPTLWMCTN